MRREAARSAGPRLMPCIRGLAVAMSSMLLTPSAVSSSAVEHDRALDAGLRLELGEQAVHVVDVPRTLDLRDHDHGELVADLGDDLRDVVEHPRRLERVDAHPQGGVAEVDVAADGDEALAGGLLALDRHGVLEVAEQDVDLPRDVGRLGTIFSFEKSRKWIIRDGVTGISRSGSGAPMASGFRKARGSRKGDASKAVGGGRRRCPEPIALARFGTVPALLLT